MVFKDSPLRGGNFLRVSEGLATDIAESDFAGPHVAPALSNPPAACFLATGRKPRSSSIKGQRPRANNSLVDGAENGVLQTGGA
jgi:hypothetical protein